MVERELQYSCIMQFKATIDFDMGELRRVSCGDYLRIKQWYDPNMELRLV